MKWDVTLNNIVKKLAEEHNVSEAEAREAIEYTMQKIRDSMELPEMPKVLIRGFGTFGVSLKRLRRRLTSLENFKKDGKISPEECLQKQEQIKAVITRREKENEKIYKRGHKG